MVSRIFDLLREKFPEKEALLYYNGKPLNTEKNGVINTEGFTEEEKKKYIDNRIQWYGIPVLVEWVSPPDVFVTKENNNTVASLRSGDKITFESIQPTQVTDTDIIQKFQSDHGIYVDSEHIHRGESDQKKRSKRSW
jgi:hypothetical protein